MSSFHNPGVNPSHHALSLTRAPALTRQEVVFALYARESHGHSLVASLLVPLDQLFSGHTLRAWVQLVCIVFGVIGLSIVLSVLMCRCVGMAVDGGRGICCLGLATCWHAAPTPH
jgi:hypothetical protein